MPPRDLPRDTDQVKVVPYVPSSSSKSYLIAFFLCVFVTGIFGAHHFYLKRYRMGILYATTFGICGFGWLIDWFRICMLVSHYNEEDNKARERGYWLTGERYGRLNKRSLIDAFIMWLPPYGFFGFHHFYLGRTRYGKSCAAVFGFHWPSWAIDFFRLPWLVYKANQDIEKMRQGETVQEWPYSTMDAYILYIFPFGFLGLHHFYLGNTMRGILYFFTLGVFGLGWLVDLFMMPLIVEKANKNLESNARHITVRPANALSDPPAHEIPPTPAVAGPSVISSNVATEPSCMHHSTQHLQPQQCQCLGHGRHYPTNQPAQHIPAPSPVAGPSVIPTNAAATPNYHNSQYQHPHQYQYPPQAPAPAAYGVVVPIPMYQPQPQHQLPVHEHPPGYVPSVVPTYEKQDSLSLPPVAY